MIWSSVIANYPLCKLGSYPPGDWEIEPLHPSMTTFLGNDFLVLEKDIPDLYN